LPKRRTFSAEFKAKVALEALREQSTLAEIAQKYELHQNQISAWKKEALESMSTVFNDKRRKDKDLQHAQHNIDELHKKVGQLTMERDFLKKISENLGLPTQNLNL
jgi:transposase-like protein